MPALRRSATSVETPAAHTRPALGLADDGSTSAGNPVLLQQTLIATAFADSPRQSYPGAVKLAIVLGAPLALWGGLIGAGVWIASKIG